MLSMGGIRNACPRGGTKALKVIYHGVSLSTVSRLLPRRPKQKLSKSSLPQSYLNTRSFRSIAYRQNLQATAPPRDNEEIEKFVREARQRFRDTLPPGYLTEEEYKLYERLYGPPLRATVPEDVGIAIGKSDADDFLTPQSSEYELLEVVEERLEGDGVGLTPEEAATLATQTVEAQADGAPELIASNDRAVFDEGSDYVYITARNKREFDALMTLQKDFEVASLRAIEAAKEARDAEEDEEDIEEEEEDEWAREQEDRIREPGYGFQESPSQRSHSLTKQARSGTYPTTLSFPKPTFIEPIQTLLRRTTIGHVAEAAESAFGGPGLPYSPITPATKRNLPMKPIGLSAGQHGMSQIDADAFIAAFMPPAYASIAGILAEVRKRLGTDWMRQLIQRGEGEGPRVLDVGAGGAGLLAWQDVLGAEWQVMQERGLAEGSQPTGKQTVVVGNEPLRHRVSRFLHNTSFIPRLPDYLHLENSEEHLDGPESPQQRKSFDIIIASHLLFPVEQDHRRKAVLNQLWSLLSPDGGVLVILEKGHPRGFEAVADARQRLLDEFLITPGQKSSPLDEIEPAYERVPEPGMIVAPCTNHTKCPMYLTPGKSAGRKDFCSFSQQFLRPPFLQSIMGASSRNHGSVEYSYVAVQRGVLPPEGLATGETATEHAFVGYDKLAEKPDMRALPRNVFPPIKRTGHVTLDLCTPAGRIERWTVPRSFGKQAYRDARKAQWGDLWALGAKTRVLRNVRLGKGEVVDDGGVRAQRAKAGKRDRVVHVGYDQRGVVSVGDAYGRAGRHAERRTKGGRVVNRKIKSLMEDLELDEAEYFKKEE